MKTKLNIQHSKSPLNTLYSVLFILILYSLFFILYSNKAYAATEFISTIKQSGGNYSTLASWEAAIQSDLTASTTAVYSGTGTGSLSQGNVLELFRSGTYQNATSTLIATTSTQILVQNYYNGGAPITLQSGDEWRKASSTANMFTVSGSGVQLGDTPIAIAQIDGAWTSADTTAVTIDGWTTDAAHYIKIYTTTAARHSGKWDTGKYRLEVNGYFAGIFIYEDYVRIDGLQISNSKTGTGGPVGAGIGQTAALTGEIRIINNIIKKVGGAIATNDYNAGISSINGFAFSGKWIIANNIIYDFNQGIRLMGGNDVNMIIYNNSVIDNVTGGIKISLSGTNDTLRLKNNLVQGATTNYSFSDVATVTDNVNNISQDATSPNIALRSKIVSFVDATNKDFHLSSSDTSAKDAGANLSADANLAFSDDIDGNTRPVGSAWDIGADETFGVIIIIE